MRKTITALALILSAATATAAPSFQLVAIHGGHGYIMDDGLTLADCGREITRHGEDTALIDLDGRHIVPVVNVVFVCELEGKR